MSGICSKHQGKCPPDCDITYGERKCPSCGKIYKPHYAHRNKAPVCDPVGYCGGVWDGLEEERERTIEHLRGVIQTCTEDLHQLVDRVTIIMLGNSINTLNVLLKAIENKEHWDSAEE